MSLRTRLLLSLGLTLTLLWGLAATWLLSGLYDQLEKTLDQRLAQSARMVAGLMEQLPQDAWSQAQRPALSIPAIEGLACQVHSPRGEVIARTHTDMADILTPGDRGHMYRQEQGITWRVFTYERNGLVITTADRMDERNLLLRNVIEVTVVPFVVALTGSLFMLWWGVSKGLAPLVKLRQALASRHPDALSPVPTEGVPAEIRPLVDTLNELLGRVQQAMAREQRFTNDAAHELRTPLTAIKTHLQVASRVDGDAARDSVALAEQGVERLARTLEQLLMLARVEGRIAFDDGQPCRVDEVMQLACADAKGPVTRIDVINHCPDAVLDMPRELAITALRNLIDNALAYGGDEPVKLVADASQSGHLCLKVRDYGPGLDSDVLSRLPRRFWRLGKGQGSGLGLAIVAAIAERFGGELSLYEPEGGGLEVQLCVPLVVSSLCSIREQ
ncbi:ATP-binding protein [Halomonas halocynthiae]|uniref:ATP-binding protein n=1 Tax=Halomonas halocynthiae TaxID=176290 RepID=UPI000425FB23|nr:ATP-binding protein [Halomonas halocynthiae]